MKEGSGWRAFERGNADVVKAEVFKVPLDRIRIKEGFNPRNMAKPATQEKIAAIKEAYKAGRYVDPIKVHLPDGVDYVEITDGECRFTAAKLADAELRAEGMPGLPNLTVIPFRGNDADRLTHAVNANEGERLTPVELAGAVKRLINMGFSRAEIARQLGKSLSWIDQLYALSNINHDVKLLVEAGRVSPEAAVAKCKQHGDEAGELLRKELEGGAVKKVTAKHVKREGDRRQIERRSASAWPFPSPSEKATALAEKVARGARDLEDFESVKIMDEATYTVCLTGAAVQAVIELARLYPPPKPKMVRKRATLDD